MFTPQGTTTDRLRAVERELREVRAELQGSPRRRVPLLARRASHVCVLDEDLTYGGTAACSIWFHDGRGGWRDSTQNLPGGAEAADWVLQPGMTLAAGSHVVVQLFGDSRWYVVRALAACRRFKAYSTTTDDIYGPATAIAMATVQINGGDICELDSSGNVVLKFDGDATLPYAVAAIRSINTGGRITYNTWLESSSDGGSSWSVVPASYSGGIIDAVNNTYGANSHPCSEYNATNGDLIRLVFDGISGTTANAQFFSGSCSLAVHPCPGITTYSLATGLTVYWTPTITTTPPATPPRTPSLVYSPVLEEYPELTELGGPPYTTGDEETYAWDLDGSDDRLYYAGRPHDTDEDFTLEIRFNLQSHGTDNVPVPLYFAHEAGSAGPSTVDYDVLIELNKDPGNSGSDILGYVNLSGGYTAAILADEIAASTWYTAFLRWDASAKVVTLDIVGGNSDDGSASGTKVSLSSPVTEIGGSADWGGSDKFNDVLIERVRHWDRRLADWELQ